MIAVGDVIHVVIAILLLLTLVVQLTNRGK
jgi:hypothetical protein